MTSILLYWVIKKIFFSFQRFTPILTFFITKYPSRIIFILYYINSFLTQHYHVYFCFVTRPVGYIAINTAHTNSFILSSFPVTFQNFILPFSRQTACAPALHFIQQYLSGTLSWPSVQSHDFLESLLHNMQHLL